MPVPRIHVKNHFHAAAYAYFASFLFPFFLNAQPPKRLAEIAAKERRTMNAPEGTSYRIFPSTPPIPKDVIWKRDFYLTLDLRNPANATLYYPASPKPGQENMFTYIFKLLLRRQIKAYDTKLDGNENFSPDNEVTGKQLMDRYHIFYEEKNGRLRVNDADIPGNEVKLYYIKQSQYYDRTSGTFHTRVTAICPVLLRGDSEFGGTDARYPMFWIKYDDIAPFLGKLMLMNSNYNNAMLLSAADFFTMNLYKGKIYKAVNLQDRLIKQYCLNDSSVAKEQRKIAKQIKDFHEIVWGKDTVVTTDTVNSTVQETKALNKDKKISRRHQRLRSLPSPRIKHKEKKSKPHKEKRVKSSSSKATFSVRRQRH